MNAPLAHPNWQEILDAICEDIGPFLNRGKVADYIPALAEVDPGAFAIAFAGIDGTEASAGLSDTPFSIQSISKVFALCLALELEGESLWGRVGREPSGTAFNSIVQLEQERGKPRNPFINAGALVVTDSIVGHCGERSGIARLLSFIRRCARTPEIHINPVVADSEAAFGDRNRSLAYFMKSFGVLRQDVPTVLDTYFNQCAIEMSVSDLARAGLFLAANGTSPVINEWITNPDRVERVNAIMMLCGHYDMSGDFAFRVGLPGKSGVGGGILAIIPNVGTVAVWSPGLNTAGNSLAGTVALEWFSHRAGINLF
ncbi:glutaminase [Parvularcula sp. LCG005]|uniref:glutaminase n=1 Tax=Parvularcula sp. LCG005 TaxID=3078805 RepID=UPI0029437433|nr:glutaminase [Parvularcula sp. LCG005]WOI53719.1 glutaminase [Parvularcula sp. LCG005]